MPDRTAFEARKPAGVNRRELFLRGSAFASAAALLAHVRRAAAAPLEYGARLYRSIGVRPVLNARGTFTIITGSETLPEVKRAMGDASIRMGLWVIDEISGRFTPGFECGVACGTHVGCGVLFRPRDRLRSHIVCGLRLREFSWV